MTKNNAQIKEITRKVKLVMKKKYREQYPETKH